MATVANGVKSFSQARDEAGLPIKVTREDIAKMGTVTWDYAEEAQARNPSDGTMGDGYMVYLHDDKDNKYMTFVGNVVLVGLIRGKVSDETGQVITPGIEFPFRARLVKDHDRTWNWAD
jgi:hypothetical protein